MREDKLTNAPCTIPTQEECLLHASCGQISC